MMCVAEKDIMVQPKNQSFDICVNCARLLTSYFKDILKYISR